MSSHKTESTMLPQANDPMSESSKLKIAFVLCGALAREIIAISKRHSWEAELFGVAAKDHMFPQRIAPDVERRLRELIPRFGRVIVVCGDWCAGGRVGAGMEHSKRR